MVGGSGGGWVVVVVGGLKLGGAGICEYRMIFIHNCKSRPKLKFGSENYMNQQ